MKRKSLKRLKKKTSKKNKKLHKGGNYVMSNKKKCTDVLDKLKNKKFEDNELENQNSISKIFSDIYNCFPNKTNQKIFIPFVSIIQDLE